MRRLRCLFGKHDWRYRETPWGLFWYRWCPRCLGKTPKIEIVHRDDLTNAR